MRLAFHPFAQQNAFRRCDDHRGADRISDVVLLSPTWANAYFIRGYCLQDLHRLAEAKNAIAQAVALSPNVLPESRILGFFYRSRRFSLQFPQTPRLRQETLVFSNSMFNRLLRTAYVLLPGSRKRLWHDYCFIAGNFKIMNIPNKTFLVLMIGAASLAVFGPMASADTMQLTLNLGNRQSGKAANSTPRQSDFAPPRWATPGDRQLTTEASKPSAWNTMSISRPARPTITESAKEPSMAAFLVAILIPFPGERRGSTCNSLQGTLSGIQLRSWTKWQRQRGSPAGDDLVAGR